MISVDDQHILIKSEFLSRSIDTRTRKDEFYLERFFAYYLGIEPASL
jgi:hypothetical protein